MYQDGDSRAVRPQEAPAMTVPPLQFFLCVGALLVAGCAPQYFCYQGAPCCVPLGYCPPAPIPHMPSCDRPVPRPPVCLDAPECAATSAKVTKVRPEETKPASGGPIRPMSHAWEEPSAAPEVRHYPRPSPHAHLDAIDNGDRRPLFNGGWMRDSSRVGTSASLKP